MKTFEIFGSLKFDAWYLVFYVSYFEILKFWVIALNISKIYLVREHFSNSQIIKIQYWLQKWRLPFFQEQDIDNIHLCALLKQFL